MGGSSPPFLYDPPWRYTYDEPTGKVFNPKAVTQASWTPRQSPPKREAPLVNFYKHPDSYAQFPYGKTNVKPMSPKTKNRIVHGRYVLLFLRVCALLGALGALVCVICIKGMEISAAWITRVAPAVAILHSVYGVYHLSRAATGRTPASSASYMFFASSVDAGLIPFYIFTAFLAHGQYTEDFYHWDTLFQSPGATYQVANATFLVTVVDSGIHAVCFTLSIFLAVLFREITKLPPDMNPLEDNLTARSHKRNKSEIAEKHLSQSTIDLSTNRMSAAEDPLIAPPRQVPFMHTRGDSSSRISDCAPDFNEERTMTTSDQSQRLSRADLPSEQMRLYKQANRSSTSLARSVARKTRESPSRPTSSSMHEAPVIEPSAAVHEDARKWSPSSSLLKDNWFVYPSSSPPPAEDQENENMARRETSSVYSRAPSTATTAYSGMKDWLSSAQRYSQEYSNIIAEDPHGEYTSLNNHEQYGNEDAYDLPSLTIYNDAEQDLGERKLSISTFDDDAASRLNPLGMNPPTPQPPPHADGLRRIVLTDIPNPSVRNGDTEPPIKNPDSENRFYGNLGPGFSTERKVSDIDQASRSQSKKKFGSKKLSRRQSRKSVAYESVKADEDDSDGPEKLTMNKRGSKNDETDRKGRVISNSGIDIGAGFQLGSGSPSSYGNYIAGLGVGRRRDVSGKIAEEGRGGASHSDFEKTPEKPANGLPGGVRAAGWARFAGL
ncbi:hypothetical protein DTO021D3_457 [Paecilomyces variotii]|nr:hypothetical protein DTO032I3_366 [Paecilomyces variotii]KAJ9283120.1 hypothetical protein DTO021D3_457 [Paecilomyces variotii]KAJ9346778.1 hypothetical protein DTO027B6_345 [Paecilomyces variotii]KAJ9393672.1 hypothetical protein DTO032I4_443 [Paecilomyces variotii]